MTARRREEAAWSEREGSYRVTGTGDSDEEKRLHGVEREGSYRVTGTGSSDRETKRRGCMELRGRDPIG
jgi:hypothetical protein